MRSFLCQRNLEKVDLVLQIEKYNSFMKRTANVNGWLKKKLVMKAKPERFQNMKSLNHYF